MIDRENIQTDSKRDAPIAMSADEFRKVGHKLIDDIADFLTSLPNRPVTPSEEPEALRSVLDASRPLPENGISVPELMRQTSQLLFDHSLFNGHPRFFGYITAGAAPIGVLGDLLAAAANPNVGSWKLGPVATEIECQTVRWIADLIGFPTTGSGLLVSGGNMANFVGFLAARTAKAKWNVREGGLSSPDSKKLCVYTSKETHTWVQKATDLFGLGTECVRWISTDKERRIDTKALRKQISADKEAGFLPFLLVGNAGTVSTGATDPLFELAAISREFDLWFHVDGAYGGFAAKVPGVSADLAGLSEADSVAVDPHKWLYAPLEAGCVLVRSEVSLTNAFSYHPPYYHFENTVTNFVDFGLQNSRGFKALKVWLALQQVGRQGYLKMIGDDIRLSQLMFHAIKQEPLLQAFTQGLSIATFRFVPADLQSRQDDPKVLEYLNKLNEALMLEIETSGKAFVSLAMLDGRFALRACIVNFRTQESDIRMIPVLVRDIGLELDRDLRRDL